MKKKKLSKKEKEKLRKEHIKKVKRIRYTSITIFIILAIGIFAYFIFLDNPNAKEIASQLETLPGFKVNVFAEDPNLLSLNLPGPNRGMRMMTVWDDTLFVTVPKKGKILAFKDKDRDGKADKKALFADGLENPHSIAFHQDWAYIAEEHQVVRMNWDVKKMKVLPKTEQVVIPDLPTGGRHWTRTITIHDGQLYLSIGSSCNNCEEEDVRRGTVLQCELDRNVCDPFAKGVRNAVGLEWYQDKLFATENGKDWAGDDFPPDEINILEKGEHYGWPYCHARNEPDEELGSKEICEDKGLPLFDIQAHSAPLGLTFYRGEEYPKEFQGELFVAYHGSWNRKTPTGYKVVHIFTEETERGIRLAGVEDFVTGWRKKNGDVMGRPVDVVNWIDGSLLISDDKAGVVYRVRYE